MKPYLTVSADVLIVGGGSAGVMAAIRAKQMDPKQKVVVFEKGDMKYSGCIARGMDAMNIVSIPGTEETPELYVETNGEACQGIMDEPVNYVMAQRTWAVMQELIDWGVCFPVDEKGEYDKLQIHNKGKFCITMKEPELKTILAAKAHEYGAEVYNRIMTLRLLKDGDRVCGAVGINVRTGEIVVCKAKSVILCSGGTARFGLPENGYLYGVYDFPGNTGDGYVMAYRPGRSFQASSIRLFTTSLRISTPPCCTSRSLVGLICSMPSHRNFKKIIRDSPHALGAYGAAWPMRIDMRHLSEEKIREVEELLFLHGTACAGAFFKGRGVDFRTGEIELWPTDCYLCGGHGLTGIRINERGESSVPGLYAAGDVSLVARGHLSGAFTYGQITAENATEYARTVADPVIDDEQVMDVIRDRDAKLAQTGGQVPIEEFEYKVRRLINDYVRPPKNEYKLDRALWWMDRFRSELRTEVCIRNQHDLFKAYEVENIIQCAAMSAVASKERKESRWGLWHMRSDYPVKDDAQWLKHIVLTQGDSLEDIRVSYAPVIKMEETA